MENTDTHPTLRSLETEADWSAIYRRELPRIYNYFRYRVGDGPAAEDLTSETFEKAWRKRAQYCRDLAAFSTWMFAIAGRVAADYFRKHEREVPLEDATAFADDRTLEGMAERQADFDRLTALLGRLEDHDRELVALRYGAGFTNRAIARLTGLTETNVGTILSRTVQKLRAWWEAEP
jgi:RNA polymerase sigma-70 factor (ECF subfamily)